MSNVKNLKDRHQGLVCTLAVILTLSFTPGCAELFCPPAVANSSYTITAENDHITAVDVNDIMVNVSVESQPLLECNLTVPSCGRFSIDPLIFPVEKISVKFVTFTGFDTHQMELTINEFPEKFKANFSVRWGRTDRLVSDADLSESCTVQEGGPVDECTPVNPCVNANTCEDTDTGFLCDCQQGYSGMTCRAGDNKLRCSDPDNGNILFWNRSVCSDVALQCYVAGPDGQSDLNITYVESFNNASADLQVDIRETDTAVSFNICVQTGLPEGQYVISYELQSPKSVDTFNYSLIVSVLYDSSPPAFNKPDERGYIFSIPEDFPDQSVLENVDKSTTPSCHGDTCIMVVDPDTGSTSRLDSLLLTVAEQQKPGPVIFQKNYTEDTFGYFYTSGQLEANNNYTFLLKLSIGIVEVDTALVVFSITDINDPPVCSTSSIVVTVDIRTHPPLILGSVSCTDDDPTPLFQEITYSLEGEDAEYFRIDETGTIILEMSLMELSPGVINFTVIAEGYTDNADASYNISIPVEVNITVPKPECNFTITSLPQTWEVNSTFVLKLECDNKGIDKLEITDLNHSVSFTYDLVPESSTAYTITFKVSAFVPGLYPFTVITSLGGPEDSDTLDIPMYNPPRFSLSYGGNIDDVSSVGRTVFELKVTVDGNALVTWNLTSGDQYSLFAPHSGYSDILLTLVESPQPYVGDNFSVVLEATDSDSSLTAEYIWNFTIIDTNQPPLCIITNTPNVNSGMPAGTTLLSINCSDPDITPEFKHLTYNITTAPPTVSFNISSRGDIVLVQPFPPGVTSVQANVTVSDIVLDSVYTINITVTVVRCPAEKGDYGLDYPATPVNTFANVSCPSVYTGQVSRFCYLNQTWDQTTYTKCRRKDLLATADWLYRMLANPGNISDLEVTVRLENVSQQLNDSLRNYSTVLSGDIKQMVGIISGVGGLSQRYPGSTLSTRTVENVARASNSLLAASDLTWTEALLEQGEEGALLVAAMDSIVSASLPHQNLTSQDPIVLEHIVIKRDSTSADIHFPDPQDLRLKKYDDARVFLDRDTFIQSYETVHYGVVLYMNATAKLRINPDLQNDGRLQDKVLNSNIVSFTLSAQVQKMSPPLELWFTVLERDYSNASCGYLNTRINDTGVWASDGCTETRQGDTVKCSCDHLTNFAILMSPFGEAPPGDNFILSIISSVGCAISIICLLLTVGVYMFLWKYVKCDRSVLHVNLCICLILAYTIFLAGVDRTDSPVGCKVVAALLHYVYLAVFCVMLSEGVEIFKSVSFVFSSKSILWKLILFSYGVPLIIVAISLGVTKAEGYGSKTSCWLSTSNGLIWAFVGPVLLILLINLIILIQVLWIMQTSKHMMNKNAQQRTRSAVRTVCILSPILGLTWVFGVLSVNRDTLVFQYLFAIFNSLQGVMIFICYCLIAHQVRDGFQAIRRKYHAKSFDSSHMLSPVSSSARQSDSETNYNQQLAASKKAVSTSTIHTLLSDSIPNGSQNHVRHVTQGQPETDTSASGGRRRNIDHHQLGGTGYSNNGYRDNIHDNAHVYNRSRTGNQDRQLPYVQRHLTPTEARAKQNWRRARDAVRDTTVSPWSSVGTSPGASYRGYEPWQGYSNAL